MNARPTPSSRKSTLEERSALAGKLAAESIKRFLGLAQRCGALEPEDAVQQGLLGFIQSYPDEITNEEGAFSYLCAAVASSAWKQRRTHRRRPTAALDRLPNVEFNILTDASAVNPEEAAIRSERIGTQRSAFARLPEDQQQVLLLGAAGYSPTEIAEILDLSPRGVRKRVQKGNAALRELFPG